MKKSILSSRVNQPSTYSSSHTSCPSAPLRVSSISLQEFIQSSTKNPQTVFAIQMHPTISIVKVATILPKEYQDFADVFDKTNASHLPEHHPYDCPIDLFLNTSPPFGPIYGLSPAELETLRNYIEENLASGFIRHSQAPAGAPIFYVKKKDDSLRLVVDYRGLNKITIRNRYSVPLIPEMLERLQGAQYFTKIDLRGAYNLICIREGD
jgi:hypothetical protein